VVRKGVIPSLLAPVAEKAAGAARRSAQHAWWWVSGETPAHMKVKKAPARPAGDPMAAALKDIFATSGVMAELTNTIIGPRVTMYEIRKHSTQSVEKILKLQKELEYAAGSPAVRIISPVPGKQRIGIEIPREKFDPIPLSAITADFGKRKRHPLLAAIGKDIEGRSIIANLAEMPHLLIAGATGAGKSACLNSILVSIITHATPEEVRMILIDPKRVEMMPYQGMPHLRMPVVTTNRKATDALQWAVDEMETRYDRLEKARVKNIDEYNAKYPNDKMSFELIVIDELADLMMTGRDDDDETEDLIVRITQKARAAGMHMVIATQRPMVKVVTGLIKANVPSRLAFAVASGVDSDTILDRRGAEKLLGKGDGLFMPAGAMFPVRIQGPLVENDEVEAAVRAAASSPAPVQVQLVEAAPDDDPKLQEAIKLVRESKNASASSLQKSMRLGFARVDSMLQSMERLGLVGPAVPGKAREYIEETS
jgi:S-DNA-T family DNA segregation ATPase FtsK/SpoIIIE